MYVLSERSGRITWEDDADKFGTRDVAIEQALKASRFSEHLEVVVKDVQDRGRTVVLGWATMGKWHWQIPIKGAYAD